MSPVSSGAMSAQAETAPAESHTDADVGETLEQAVARLTLENQVLSSRLKNYGATIERLTTGASVDSLALEGIISRQREVLRSNSHTLWKRKQTIRALREKLATFQDAADFISQISNQLAGKSPPDQPFETAARVE